MRKSNSSTQKTVRKRPARPKKSTQKDTPTFHQSVIRVIKRIPKGRVASYGMIAMLAGNPRAARQVVRTLNTASREARLPWHRVINREGRIALKPGQGFELQRAMLIDEGVSVSPDGQIDLEKYLWSPRRRTV